MNKLIFALSSLFLAYGTFELMSDGFPFNESSNPAYHAYGWPVCFATSNSFLSYDFHLFSFSWSFLFLDLAIMVTLLVLALATLKRFSEHSVAFSIGDWLLLCFSLGVLCAYFAFDLQQRLPFFQTTLPNHSTKVGDWRELRQCRALSGRIVFPLLIFLASNQFGYSVGRGVVRPLKND
jgi:hypothetical protein